MTLKQLEKKIAAMEKRLTVLENKTRRNGRKPRAAQKARKRGTARTAAATLTEQEKQARILETLRARGMISEPTEREKQLAAEWNARPAAERQRILDQFANLPLEKSLADIVIEGRR